MSRFMIDVIKGRKVITLAQVRDVFGNSKGGLIGFFTSYQFKEIIFTVKTISLIISLVLAFLIFILLIKINFFSRVRGSFSRVKKSTVINPKKLAKKWAKIEKKISSGVEANYKLAVLEADNIFNDILKNLGYEAELRVTNMNEIKQARKVKNNIIEDSNFSLTEIEVQKIIDIYKKGLQDLKVL